MKRTINTVLTFFCALFLSCGRCDVGGSAITYRIDGDADNATVLYHNEYEEKIYHSSVSVPWEATFNIQFRDKEYYGGGARKDNYMAYISAGVIGSSFPITASIYVNGELVRSDSTTAANYQADVYYLVRYCD